jgi:hypothetical protein
MISRVDAVFRAAFLHWANLYSLTWVSLIYFLPNIPVRRLAPARPFEPLRQHREAIGEGFGLAFI